jgi:hypothetical protein
LDFKIEVASAHDVATMTEWAADEGWNPGNTDRFAFQAADPGGFLIGWRGGLPVACISVVRYGAGFGFLGYYIARPEVRGQGYGLQVWNAGMARLAGRNVGLDGVVAQQGNYAKSGFRRAWANVRHQGTPPPATVPLGVALDDASELPFDKLAAYDRRFFPEPRDSFLASWISLPERRSLVALSHGELVGFAVLRASRAESRIGPLYADSAQIAHALVSELAEGKPVAIDVPDRNTEAMELMQRLGLTPAFETARMYTGAEPAIEMAGLFGVASLELG